LQDAVCRIHDAGCKIQDSGYRIQDTGNRIEDLKSAFILPNGQTGKRAKPAQRALMQDTGIQDARFRIQDPGCGIQDSGFRVEGLNSDSKPPQAKPAQPAKRAIGQTD
jgi:hypothetical protein